MNVTAYVVAAFGGVSAYFMLTGSWDTITRGDTQAEWIKASAWHEFRFKPEYR